MERFFSEHCGAPYHGLVSQDRIGFPTVSVEAQFEKPLIYGDDIEVLIEVVKVSRRSVTLSYGLVRSTDMVQCAKVTMVHVAMNLDSRQSIEIPDTLRLVLENSKLYK